MISMQPPQLAASSVCSLLCCKTLDGFWSRHIVCKRLRVLSRNELKVGSCHMVSTVNEPSEIHVRLRCLPGMLWPSVRWWTPRRILRPSSSGTFWLDRRKEASIARALHTGPFSSQHITLFFPFALYSNKISFSFVVSQKSCCTLHRCQNFY